MCRYTIFFFLWLIFCGLVGVPGASGMGSGADKSADPGVAPQTGTRSGDARDFSAQPPAWPHAQPPAPAGGVQSQYNNSNVYNSTTVYNSGEGYNGYAGTWRDPETGDIITSVIAPRQPQQPSWNAPVIVAPQVYPGYNDSPNPPGPPPYPPGPPPRPHPYPPGPNPYPPGPPPRPHPGPHPGPYPGQGPGSVPPWQQPGWQNPRPPQGQMPPGWRPPSNTRPWPHAPGYLPTPRNNISPSGGGMSGPGPVMPRGR